MDVKVFNRWSVENVKVVDLGLQKYISLQPRIIPRTGGRNAAKRFHKSKSFIVERLINKLMGSGHKAKKHFRSSGHNTGKSERVYQIVEKVFEKLEQRTKKNPVEVFLRALENAAPREEIITIEYGGARYPKAVECAPQRRIDITLRQMTQGASQKAFNSKRSIVDTLTEEILAAFELSQNSQAIAKKLELERQADASR